MPSRLIAKYGMDDARRAERKRYLSIEPQDEKAVGELHELSQAFAPALAEGFYRHLLAHPVTARFLEDPQLLARLKSEQMKYFQELVSGDYGEAYFERRLRVGEAHQRVGVEPAWYLGAYNQYIQLAFPFFADAVGGRVNPVLMSLLKVILLDIGLALETYFAEGTEQLRLRNQELKDALDLYWQAELRAQQYAKLAGHEIRGSLNAIAAACDAAVEDFGDQMPQEARSMLDHARRRCWNTVEVVERILSEPEHAGRRDWVAPLEIIKEAVARVDVYKDLYAVKQEVRVSLPAHCAPVWADRIALREVFANLIANAIRHLDKDPGLVSIECIEKSREVVFCVADNGPGMPPDVQQRVFEPFYRGPEPKPGGGKGLGLHFVRSVVSQHHGRVWVESEPGSGSRFYFSLRREGDDSGPQVPAGQGC